MRRLLTIIVAGAAGAAAVALPAAALAGGGQASAAANHRVVIKNYAYTPGNLVVHRNDTVTWLFEDGPTAHNVTATRFRSSPTKASGSYTVRFTHSGTYDYTCTLHPWMSGSVVVR